jgi:hypothetical protein
MITSCETRPIATCVAVVDNLSPASHIWPPPIQILAATALTEIESIFPEMTMAVSHSMGSNLCSFCAHIMPSVCCVWTSVPELHASMAAMFEHFKPDHTPWSAHVYIGFTITPTMQAIVVDSETIINPQLAAIVRNNA